MNSCFIILAGGESKRFNSNIPKPYIDDNWHCLTVSRRDPKTGKFSLEKVPVYHIVDENEKRKAS